MMKSLKSFALLSIIMLMLGCAGSYQKQYVASPLENLARQIDLQVSVPELETAMTGIMVQSAETGEILYQRNAHKLFMPASNEKIPTSAAALLKFGPDFQYQTKICTTGKISDGVLKGDLIIIGSGDPTMSNRFCEDVQKCHIFQSWADSLKNKGIRKIEGDIIGVDDVFDDESIGYGWTLNNLSYAYSAPIGGLMYYENSADLFIKCDSSTGTIDFCFLPDLGYFQIESDIQVDDNKTEIMVDRVTETNLLRLRGKIQPGVTYIENISVHNPTMYFLTGLKAEFNDLGIETTGQIIDADSGNDKENLVLADLLFVHNSPVFKDVLAVLLKRSQNLYAESFVKLLGHHFNNEGSFEAGEKVIKETLGRFGLDMNSYSFMDGSGLSRYNYISPYLITKILRGMYNSLYRETYKNCLAIAGVDGTIGYRMKNSVAHGKIIAKTGTISNVRCLSGYAITADGETLVFSTMFNNFLCSVNSIMDIQDQICMLLASFSRKK